MATDSLKSPQSSECMDEWGSGLWKEGDSDSAEDVVHTSSEEVAPKVEEEDLCTDAPDQEMSQGESVTQKLETLHHLSTEGLPSTPLSNNTTLPAEGATEPESNSLPDQANESNIGSDDQLVNENCISSECQEIQLTAQQDRNIQAEEETEEVVEKDSGVDSDKIEQTQRENCETAKTPSQEHPPESQEDDSPICLSEESEKHSVDYKPLDITSARKQWVKLDSTSSKPPKPACSRTSFRSQITDPIPLQGTQRVEQTLIQPGTGEQDTLQGELMVQNHSSVNKQQEVQQVCKGAPPLETVADVAANPERGSPISSSVAVKEPLKETGGRGEESESEQTEREGEQRQSDTHRGEAGREDCREEEDLNKVEKTGKEKESKVRSGSQGCPQHPKSRMELDHSDDSQSDSGVSADFSPSSTVELSEREKPQANETPIEREIRLAIKREQSLRRSRGLNKNQEFVEIPLRKLILSQEMPPKSVNIQNKDRHLAGMKMQREIRIETEREKELVKLGRLPGFYDKGTVREVRERKLLFEAFQEPKESEILSRRPASVSTSDISTLTFQEIESSRSPMKGGRLRRGHSLDFLSENTSSAPTSAYDGGLTYTPHLSPGPNLTDGTSSQTVIRENNATLQSSMPKPKSPLLTSPGKKSLKETGGRTVVDSATMRLSLVEDGMRRDFVYRSGEIDEDEDALPKENPFYRLRPSMSLKSKLEQDIQEAVEREKELRRQRSRMYGGTGAEGGGGGEVKILSRETRSLTSSQTSLNTPKGSGASISAKSVGQSSGKLGLTWPPQQLEEAGKVHSEVQKSTKNKNHLTPLFQRWESGMVNGHGEDSD